MAIIALFLVIVACSVVAATDSSNISTNNGPDYNSDEMGSASYSIYTGSSEGTLPDPQIWRDGIYIATYTTIQGAINSAENGDTIMLEENAIFNEQLIIDKNLDINVLNNGHATLDGTGITGSIITIETGVNVNLYNLTIQNGDAYEGGAIYNEGNLNVTDCLFDDNFAEDGGAIWSKGTLNTTRSAFTDNHAIGDVYGGGAICNDYGGTLNVSDCNFTDNYDENGHGGAILNVWGISTVTNSTFTLNYAVYGGAIYNGINGTMTVTSSDFTFHYFTDYGTIICNGGIAELHFNRFFENPGSFYNDEMYCLSGSINAENNWWGSNTDPSSKVTGTVDVDPWIKLNITATPSSIQTSGVSTITADLTLNSDDQDTTLLYPGTFIPNGIQAKFVSDALGSFGGQPSITSTTIDGKATAIFTPYNTPGVSTVNVSVDEALNIPTTITITPTPIVNTRTSKTYKTVQDAINDPETINGDTINVTGSFSENVTVNKSLIIRADGSATVNALDVGLPVFTITTAGVGSIIQGFTITGATSSFGIYLSSAYNCQITGNILSGNFIGIYIQNSYTNVVSGNNIQNNGWIGICLDNSNQNTINGGNVIGGNVEGVYIVNTSSENTITGNNIHDNTDAGINVLNSSSGNNITGNMAISNNGVMGILIREVDTTNISDNYIENNGWAGIVLDQAIGTYINGCKISENLEGIQLTNNSYQNTVEGNNITGNINIGISLINSSHENYILNNTAISNNGIIGVYIRGGDTNTVYGNNVQGNGWVGACLDQTTANPIYGSNNISGNLEGLYLVNNSNNNTIQGNNIHENMDTGIYVDSSTGNNIMGNTAISSNGVVGILFRNANGNTISSNTLAGNSFAGVALDNADSNMINGSNIVSGSQMGVYITNNSTGNTVTGNILQENTWAGMVLDYAVNTLVYQNNFINNPVQALAQNGTGNTFYDIALGGNYWNDWSTTDPRSINGNEGLYDEYPSTTPF